MLFPRRLLGYEIRGGLVAIGVALALASTASAQRAAASRSGGLFGAAADEPVNSPARVWRAAAVAPESEELDLRPPMPRRIRPAAYEASYASPAYAEEPMEIEGSMRPMVADEAFGYNDESYGEAVYGGNEYAGGWPDNLWLFAGTAGFKGPVDQGRNGNFGFQEGVNYTMPLSYERPISAQIGARFTQSDFSGSELDPGTRNQLFLTAGLFRRTHHGWQFGAAFDWLRDEFYAQLDVHQVRAELSWVSLCGNELGFTSSSSTADNQVMRTVGTTTIVETFEVNNQFAAFLRIPFACGGDTRVFVGATSDRDGILGADLSVPINEHWSVTSSVLYLIPEESNNGSTGANLGSAGEQWGISMGLVWYPGRCPVEGLNPLRPLFDVADNTSLLVNRVRHQ